MSSPQFEVLPGLPGYGPMYISVTENDTPYFSEGYVLRIFKTDGSSWVANFKPGRYSFSRAFDYPDKQRIVVIAGGQGYIITPNNERSKATFGGHITEVLQTEFGVLVCAARTHLIIVDVSKNVVWETERLSLDGIKDLTISGRFVSGLSLDIRQEDDVWLPFTVDLVNEEVDGGAYREMLDEDTTEDSEIDIIQMLIPKDTPTPKKLWWKFWA